MRWCGVASPRRVPRPAAAQVTMIAVTKTYPAADVLHLVELGVLDVGENRDQEAAGKAAQVAAAGVVPRWHFIGQLQRNKCRSVVSYADVVHSVDSVRLARALGEAAVRGRKSPVDVLVQVSVDGDPDRGGALAAGDDLTGPRPGGAGGGRRAGSAAGRINGGRSAGLDPGGGLRRGRPVCRAIRAAHPDATVVSAGMSGDVDTAIAYGATHVRIGSALLESAQGCGSLTADTELHECG